MQGLLRKNVLLKSLREKKITLDDLYRECAKWTVEIIDQYKFEHVPEKPKVVEGYEQLPPSVKNNLADEYFSDHPEVREFYQKRMSIKQENKALYDWLKQCVQYVDTANEKEVLLRKLDEVSVEEI